MPIIKMNQMVLAQGEETLLGLAIGGERKEGIDQGRL